MSQGCPSRQELLDELERLRAQLDRERLLTSQLLGVADSAADDHALMRGVTELLREWSGCEAAGIRLRRGDDFPYFETRGFPPEFVAAENSLCIRDPDGQVARDSQGNPVLECMCGNILCGRFDPALPFFTPGGSFWSNATTELLASTTESQRQARTRNRCNGEGYESVALVPLRSNGSVLGLLQLNDRRRGRFSAEFIRLLETLGATLAAVLAGRLAIEETRRVNALLQSIKDAQSLFIAERDPAAVFQGMLKTLIKATESQYGFLDEVLWREDGTAYKRNLAMTNIAWDDASNALYARLVSNDHLLPNLDNLAGAPVIGRQVVIANDVAHDSRSRGLPPGHPPVHCFLGIPLYSGGELIGVAGVANREGGYTDDLVKFVEPLATTCAGMIAAARARRAVEESELKYRVVADNTSDWEFWIDPQGRFRYVSPSCLPITGHEPGEFLADPGLLLRIVHPADRTEVDRHLEDGEVGYQRFEFRIVHADGTLRWIGHACQPVFDHGRFLGLRGSNRDITDRKQAETALRESQQRYRKFLETAREGVWAMDAEHRTTFVNRRMAEMLGYEAEQIVGVKVEAFMYEEDWVDHARQMTDRRQGRDSQYERRFRRKDGSELWTQVSAAALTDDEGRFAGSFAMFSDITERRKNQRRLAELELQLYHASRLTTLGELAAGIAHEVNQPLCSVVNFAKACRNLASHEPADLEQIRGWSDAAASAAASAGDIIRRLIHFARRSQPEREAIAVRDLIDNAQSLVHHESRRKGVAIQPSMAEEDLSVWAQAVSIQQVLVNLLRNSIEAFDAASPDNRRIVVSAARAGDLVEIAVADNGPGLSEDQRAKIFEPFFTTKREGLGLGLAISKTIVEEHGGSIWATCAQDGGLAVHFALPSRRK